MTEEFSAGGIVIKNDTHVLVSQHSGHHGWVFPKGHVGDTIPNETPEEAAIREVEEETGIVGEIFDKVLPVDYWYQFEGEKRHKTVQYYLMRYVSGDTKNHGWEMENVEWLPIEEVGKRLDFASDKKAWQEAKLRIDQKLLKHLS